MVSPGVKNPPANAGNEGSVPGLGRFPGVENGNPLQYSCLENLHGQRILTGYSLWVTNSRTRLSEHAHTYKYIYIYTYTYIMEYCPPMQKEIL